MKKLTYILAFLVISLSSVAQVQTINVGSAANDGTGATLRDAFIQSNSNFSYLDSLSLLKVNSANISQIMFYRGGDTLKFSLDHVHTEYRLNDNAYGELYDPSTVISTAVTGRYYTLSGWTTGATYGTTLNTDSTIQVSNSGYYLINFSMSFTHATNNTVVHICAFNSTDNEELTNIETERKIGTGGDVGNVGGVGIVRLDAGDKVCIRAKASNTGNLTVNHGNFNLIRVL